MSWSWFTGPLTYKDRCTLCGEPLQKEAAVVLWTDGYRYHVGCLLNLVSQYRDHYGKPAVATGADCGGIGYMYGQVLGGTP
jgi:hypothetical protein